MTDVIKPMETTISDTDLEKAEENPSRISGIKAGFVDFVNPKFKAFNRPLLLALLVTFVTLIGFVVTLRSILNECTERVLVRAGWQLMPWDEYLSIRTTNGRRRLAPALAHGCDLGEGELCELPTGIECIYGVLGNHVQTSSHGPLVTGGNCKFARVAQETFGRDNYCYPEAYDAAPIDCDAASDNTDVSVKDAMFTVGYKECPDVVTALGAAFGWVGMIEGGSAVIFISILMATGLIKNDHASFRDIVKNVMEDTGVMDKATDVVKKVHYSPRP